MGVDGVVVAYGGWVGAALGVIAFALALLLGYRRWVGAAPWALEALRSARGAVPIDRATAGARSRALGRIGVGGQACTSPADERPCAAFDVDTGDETRRVRAADVHVRVGARTVPLQGPLQLDATTRDVVVRANDTVIERLAAQGIAVASRARVASLSVGELVIAIGHAHAVSGSDDPSYRAPLRIPQLSGEPDEPVRIVGVRTVLRALVRACVVPITAAAVTALAWFVVVPIVALEVAPPAYATPNVAGELHERLWLALLSPPFRATALARLDRLFRDTVADVIAHQRRQRPPSPQAIEALIEIAVALRDVAPSCEREAFIVQLAPDVRAGVRDGCAGSVVTAIASVIDGDRVAPSARVTEVDADRYRTVWRALLASADQLAEDRSEVLDPVVCGANTHAEREAAIAAIGLSLDPQQRWVRSFVARRFARLSLIERDVDLAFARELRAVAARLDDDFGDARAFDALFEAEFAREASPDEVEAAAGALTSCPEAAEPIRSWSAWEFGVASRIERGMPGARGSDRDPRLYPALRHSAPRREGTDLMVLGAEAIALARAIGRHDVPPTIASAMAQRARVRGPSNEWAEALRAPVAAFLAHEVTEDRSVPPGTGREPPPALSPFETVELPRDLCGDPLEPIARAAWFDLPLCETPGAVLWYLRGRYQFHDTRHDIVMIVESEPGAPYDACGSRRLDVRYLLDGHVGQLGYPYEPISWSDARALLRATVFEQAHLWRGAADGPASICFDTPCRDALAATIRDPELARVTRGAPVGITGSGDDLRVLAIEPTRNPADLDDPEPFSIHWLGATLDHHLPTVQAHELQTTNPPSVSVYGRPLAPGEVPGTLRLVVRPSGLVDIDGRCLTASSRDGFPVAPGTHSIHVRAHGSDADETFSIDVWPGGTVTRTIDFDERAP